VAFGGEVCKRSSATRRKIENKHPFDLGTRQKIVDFGRLFYL